MRGQPDIDNKIGKRIRARRLALRVSQSGLAEVLGVSYQQVQKYEGGKNGIKASSLPMLARALHWPARMLIDGLGPMTQREAAEHRELNEFLESEECVKMMTMMLRMTPAGRAKAVQLVAGMA